MKAKPLRRVLALDASTARGSVILLDDDRILAQALVDGPHGVADALPVLVQDCLAEAAIPASRLDAIAVTIGPGSFTGLRASIALARGLGLAAGVPVHGVTLGEVFAPCLVPGLMPGRALWIAMTARKGRVFLERDGVAAGFADNALPEPQGPVAIAGNQAITVAARLAAAGHDVLLTRARQPDAAAIAHAARARHQAGRPPHPAIPLYIDPPEAKLANPTAKKDQEAPPPETPAKGDALRTRSLASC